MTGNVGCVLWITGFSGSGKTTLAKALLPHLGPKAILLDGDELREVLGVANCCFEPEDRLRLAFTYARLARMLARQGCRVVVATISLFHAVHDWNRGHLPNYLEILLDVPEDERRRRDPKGLYAQANNSQGPKMSHQQQAELPLQPHLYLHHSFEQGIDAHVSLVLDLLRQCGWRL